jgi:hypothetical protein
VKAKEHFAQRLRSGTSSNLTSVSRQPGQSSRKLVAATLSLASLAGMGIDDMRQFPNVVSRAALKHQKPMIAKRAKTRPGSDDPVEARQPLKKSRKTAQDRIGIGRRHEDAETFPMNQAKGRRKRRFHVAC